MTEPHRDDRTDNPPTLGSSAPDPTPRRELPRIYREPRLRPIAGLSALLGRITGREYDGPGRYYFDGF